MQDEDQDKIAGVEEVQEPLPVQAPLSGQAPLPGQAPSSGPAPLPGQAPLPGHAPLPGQAPLPEYTVRIHSRLRQQVPVQQPVLEHQQELGQQRVPEHSDILDPPLPVAEQQEFGAQPRNQEPQVYEIQHFLEPPVDKEQQYIEQQEQALAQPQEPVAPPAKPCRHEYVRIFQRKLKDLNRRMVCTKAYLPVGFKMGDFSHLGENSFCFCATCRARLYPKRSQAEKAEARVQLAHGKALKLEQSLLSADLIEEVGAKALAELLMRVEDDEDAEPDEVDDENVPKIDIHVEELEQEVVDMEDIDVGSLKANQEEESCELLDQEEM